MEYEFLSVTGICLLSSILLGVFIISNGLGNSTDNEPEPYHIPSVVPYLGHLLGIIWHRNRYYTKIRYDDGGWIDLA